MENVRTAVSGNCQFEVSDDYHAYPLGSVGETRRESRTGLLEQLAHLVIVDEARMARESEGRGEASEALGSYSK